MQTTMTKPPPKTARRSYYADVGRYWDAIEAMRTKDGLPEWCFDFVSIHRRRGQFSLLGPTCFIRRDKRPRFESRNFERFADAKAYAMRITKRRSAIGQRIHVVNCAGVTR